MGLDGVEMVMLWEERFGISIPDSDLERTDTPRKAADLIERTLTDRDEVADRSVIDSFLRETITDFFGVPEESYSEDGHFVRDFGLE